MKKTPHPIQNISDVLQKDPTIFSLITKAKEIEMLDGLVKKEIGSDLLDHCQVASYDKGVLTLITTSNAFATQLRFKSFDIRDKLRQTPKWSGLSRIQIKIDPKSAHAPSLTASQDPVPIKPTLPYTVSRQLLALADTLPNKPGSEALKKALKRLAEHGET